MGRPSKFTEAVRQEINGYIRLGHFSEVACTLAGVSSSTFYRWMEKGRNAKSGRYREFWEAIQTSKAVAEAKYLEVVRDVANDQRHKDRLKAATWWLERRHAGRYAPTQINKIEGEIGLRRAEELTDDQLADIARGGG